jgi:hypothetical protein
VSVAALTSVREVNSTVSPAPTCAIQGLSGVRGVYPARIGRHHEQRVTSWRNRVERILAVGIGDSRRFAGVFRAVLVEVEIHGDVGEPWVRIDIIASDDAVKAGEVGEAEIDFGVLAWLELASLAFAVGDAEAGGNLKRPQI